jgi:hypothetical protein
MGRLKTAVRVVNAFTHTPRGGTQLPDPDDNAAESEPEDDQPLPAQQQTFAQPAGQGSSHDPSQPWASPPLQQPAVPPYQSNHFAALQNFQSAAHSYNGPQPPPLPQRGWTDSARPYPPHQAQPPQTPTTHNTYSGFPANSYASSTSNYDQYYQYASSINSNPPPQTSPVPSYSNQATYSPQTSSVSLHSSAGAYSPPQSHSHYLPQLPQRSQTEPQLGSSYGPQSSQSSWTQIQTFDHNCNEYRYP